MKVFSVGVSLLALASASDPDYDAMWTKFKADFSKSYDSFSNEEEKRFQIFKDNVDIIEAHNAKGLSYQLGVNELADLTVEEYSEQYLGYQPELRRWGDDLVRVPFPNTSSKVADAIDWVAKGAVTPVKNQQRCGSCWAFSSTGSIEGAYQIASGKLVSLSEEDLVQCDHNGDQGCKGGLMDHAFGWVKSNGICTEADYPYTSGGGVTGSCKKSCSPAVTVTGYTDVPQKDEDALKAAVSKQPVSVAIEADKSVFQLYKSGVFDNAACGTKLDHGVLVVGYGTDGGKDYWKVKNSWGTSFGEQGYIRMARNKNTCGISQQPSYPTGAKAASPSPTPPTPPTPPSPPTPPGPPSDTHYEDPKGGCRSDEVSITIQNVQGAVCAPGCGLFKPCPTDVPTGVTAKPQCALQDSSTKKKYCALICTPSKNDDQCGENASCKNVQMGVGICTYDDDADLKADVADAKYDAWPTVVV